MSETPAPYHVYPLALPVMECPVAGFQFHGGEACWALMRPGDRLSLRREPGNHHDPRAITVQWRDVTLGFVPREANYALSQMMDRGVRVAARVVSLRAGSDPWQRVMMQVVCLGGTTDPGIEPPPKPFATSELLVRSLVNRIFGATPFTDPDGWVRDRAAAIALAGVEHPGMLPFLRLVADDKTAATSTDPLSALSALLRKTGLEASAWKFLPRWGFSAFEALGSAWLKPIPVARFANLLLHMGITEPPPPKFVLHARSLAFHGLPPDARLDFERYPPWFMRGVLNGVRASSGTVEEVGLAGDFHRCAEWFHEAKPTPDANQQHAGWKWMLKQANDHNEARRLAIAWDVPIQELTFGAWRIVPLRSVGDVVAEAAAMKNCLDDYNYIPLCQSGKCLVFSIRSVRTGKRAACFTVDRERTTAPWCLDQVAGKANSKATTEMRRIAELVVDRLASLDKSRFLTL